MYTFYFFYSIIHLYRSIEYVSCPNDQQHHELKAKPTICYLRQHCGNTNKQTNKYKIEHTPVEQTNPNLAKQYKTT